MVAKAVPEPSGTGAHLRLMAPPRDNRVGGDRPKVMMPATIVCPDGTVHACVIRDMSVTGAKLGVSRRNRLPRDAALVIPGCDFAYPVVLKWQRGDFAGVLLGPQAAGPEPEAG